MKESLAVVSGPLEETSRTKVFVAVERIETVNVAITIERVGTSADEQKAVLSAAHASSWSRLRACGCCQ